MTIDWTPLADLLETHDRFLVTTHVRPDGDARCSEVGMAGLLRQKGKDVRVVNASLTPPRSARETGPFARTERNTTAELRRRSSAGESAGRDAVIDACGQKR